MTGPPRIHLIGSPTTQDDIPVTDGCMRGLLFGRSVTGPAIPGGPAERVKVTGKPVNPYDQKVLPNAHGGCQATTGT